MIAELSVLFLLWLFVFPPPPLSQVNNVMIWKNNSKKGILSWVYTKRWVWCLWCKQACVQLQNTAGTENNKGSKERWNQTAAQACIPPLTERNRSSDSGDNSREKNNEEQILGLHWNSHTMSIDQLYKQTYKLAAELLPSASVSRQHALSCVSWGLNIHETHPPLLPPRCSNSWLKVLSKRTHWLDHMRAAMCVIFGWELSAVILIQDRGEDQGWASRSATANLEFQQSFKCPSRYQSHYHGPLCCEITD